MVLCGLPSCWLFCWSDNCRKTGFSVGLLGSGYPGYCAIPCGSSHTRGAAAVAAIGRRREAIWVGWNGRRVERGELALVIFRKPPKWWWKISEEHTSELQSRFDLVCRLLLEKKNKKI